MIDFEIQYVPADHSLFTIPTIQRPLNRDRVNAIAKAFNINRFDYIVARLINGKLEVIDGQHRLAAAIAAGIKEVPVRVLHIDDEEAARQFAMRNSYGIGEDANTQPVKLRSMIAFLAGTRVEGTKNARVADIAKRYRIKLALGGEEGAIQATLPLNHYSEDILEKAFRLMSSMSIDAPFTSRFVDALCCLIKYGVAESTLSTKMSGYPLSAANNALKKVKLIHTEPGREGSDVLAKELLLLLFPRKTKEDKRARESFIPPVRKIEE